MTNSKRREWAGFCLVAALASALAFGGYVVAQTGDSNPAGGIAQPPRILAYSGFLEQNGVTVDATTPMRFFITDSPSVGATACGGATGCLWISSAASSMNVPVNDGHFSVVLGDAGQTPFPAALFTRSTLYLRALVGPMGASEQTLSGAQRLVATPYSITSETPTTFRVNTIEADDVVATHISKIVVSPVATSTTPSGASASPTPTVITTVETAKTTFCSLVNDFRSFDGATTFVSSCSINSSVSGLETTWTVRATHNTFGSSNTASVTCSARCITIP